jgi:uncharacterized protein DUF6602
MNKQLILRSLSMSPDHDLKWLLDRTAADIASEYQRIQTRVKEDPGTAGDQGEENWAEVLRKYLPANYHVRTKGRIVAANGSASRQIDVLVLSPSYPVGLLDIKTYVAAGVLAAFECKITLRREHIETAMKIAAELSDLVQADQFMEHRIIYGLLAHSHAFAHKQTAPGVLVTTALNTAFEEYVSHPDQFLDVLCVSDLGTWVAQRTVETGSNDDYIVKVGYYRTVARQIAPVAAFMTSLMIKLGVSNPALKEIAGYFVRALPGGVEVGVRNAIRHWHFSEMPTGP